MESVVDENRKLGVLVTKKIRDNYYEKNISKQITDEEIIKNLKHQVQILTAEKSSIEELWKTSQKTITNLETALSHYYKHFNDNQPSIDEVFNLYSRVFYIIKLFC